MSSILVSVAALVCLLMVHIKALDTDVDVNSGGDQVYINWLPVEYVCFPANTNSTISFQFTAQDNWNGQLIMYYNDSGLAALASNASMACWDKLTYAENYDPYTGQVGRPVQNEYAVQYLDDYTWNADYLYYFTYNRGLLFVVASCSMAFDRVDVELFAQDVTNCGGSSGLSETNKVVVGVVVGVGGTAFLALVLVLACRLYSAPRGAIKMMDPAHTPHPPPDRIVVDETPEGYEPPAGTVVPMPTQEELEAMNASPPTEAPSSERQGSRSSATLKVAAI